MPLQLKKRHIARCRRENRVQEWDHTLTRCRCPYFAEGTISLDGYTRKSTREHSFNRAEAVKRLWEERGTTKVALRSQPPPEPDPDPTDTHTTLEKAKREFATGYMEAKHLANGTRRGYATMLKFLTRFAESRGIRFVDEFDLEEMQEWQKTWGLNPRSAAKRLELTRCFFEFCLDREWIAKNPTKKVHVARSGVEQKEPFLDSEVNAILAATRAYATKRPPRAAAGASRIDYYGEGPRVEAITLLMLYGGLRISDASFLRCDELDSRDRVTYYPMKANGERQERPVTVKLPHPVAEKLRALPVIAGNYLFTTGKGSERTVTGVWYKKFKRLFAIARALMGRDFSHPPHPHRFRHTFAVRLLQRGVSVEDVRDALGHTDHRITLKHYRRWVPGLQDRLDRILDDAWAEENRPFLVKNKLG